MVFGVGGGLFCAALGEIYAGFAPLAFGFESRARARFSRGADISQEGRAFTAHMIPPRSRGKIPTVICFSIWRHHIGGAPQF